MSDFLPAGSEPLAPHPDDMPLLDAVRSGNDWLRGVTCTLARRGVALRQADPQRARALLDALSTWPFYRAGQFLFDLLELEDFMLDGEAPESVPTTLDGAALRRLATALRTLQRNIDGAIDASDDDLPPAQALPAWLPDELPPIEPGFYLYQDVVLGIALSAGPYFRDQTPPSDEPSHPGGPAASAAPDAPVAATAGDVAISHIHFKGAVKRTQSDEYVEITNRSNDSVDVSGWVLGSRGQSQTFAFPRPTTLEPGQVVRVYTNEVHPETGGYSFGSRRAIWNDNGDTGTLSLASGTVVSQLGYGDNAP